jgi:site-specific DNA recombinase
LAARCYGYDLAKVVDVSQTDAFGDPRKIGTTLRTNAAEAKVVREIYHLYADIGLSTDAIAATLNARGIASPGASWKNRKVRRSDGKWLGSTIVGMLANPLYFGDYRWNVSKWVKDPETGAKKRLERPAEEVLQQYKPEWRIFTDATLRDRVQVTRVRRARIRGAAISSGIANAKRIGGADSRFWLGSILKCGVCGANYIGDSARDYVCPGHKPGACSNDMRVRRDAVNEAVYAVVKSHLLSQDAIARTRRELEAHFKALEREEEVALRKGANSKALLKLDKQIAEVRSNDWPQSAKAAAISAFEGEREAITSRTKGAAGERTNRARALLAKVPAMVEDYRRTVETGFKVLAEPKNVSKARELLRGWLMNGTIVLTPNVAHTAIVGRVEFAGLEEQFLNWAGFKRKVGTRPRKPRNEPTSHVTMVAGAGFEPATFGL